MTSGGWTQAKRILCIRLDYMGDVLMSTPAIRALKQSNPGSEITLLTSGSGAAIARFIPEIDDAMVYAAPWMKSSAAHEPCADMEMIATLAKRRFDAAVIFTVYSQNPLPAAMLCYLAGIPLRLAHCRENPYQLLTDWVRETEPADRLRHEARRQLDLVAAVGARADDERLSLRIPSAYTAGVIDRLQSMGIDPHATWVAMHPGATAASRRYPPQHWREVARTLSATLHCPLVFTGSEDETSLVEEIRHGLPDAHSLAGQLDLGQLSALIALAPVLVSNNTGPAHIAAAVGTPVVDLYALTNPQHTPWQVPSRVLYKDVPCRYCYKSLCPEGHNLCLTGVAPLQVVRAVNELLGGQGAVHDTLSMPPMRG
ncbi:MAG TPA: lipopolysaccharide heptosyltransferase II [Noviherbaspirillum sp.]|nr:lipopolysaccharide heptosyltransferase II [Noviherbaspirillum sp.]